MARRATQRVSKRFNQPSLTKQSFKDECNINKILAGYQKTGIIDHVAKFAPQYGEYDAVDYKTAMDVVSSANSMFEELPSKARAHFEHDPVKFLDYVNSIDETDDLSSLVELGLAHETRLVDAILTPKNSPERTEETPSSEGSPIDPT